MFYTAIFATLNTPPIAICLAQDNGEVAMPHGAGGPEATSAFKNGLNSPNYVRLLSDLTDLAGFAERHPALVPFEFIPFSKSQRDTIRNRINELLQAQSASAAILAQITEKLAKEMDPEVQSLLQAQYSLILEERDYPYRVIAAEVAPLLDRIQRQQLRDVGIGVVLTNNTIDDLFSNAVESAGLALTRDEVADMVNLMHVETGRMILERARKTRESWERFIKVLPQGMDSDIEEFFGLDLLNDDRN